MRYKQVNSTNNVTTYYFNDREYEEFYEGSTKIQRTYVDDVLVRETRGGNVTVTYLHYDHLGSTEAMSNAAGIYIERMSFGPWGGRQQDNWRAGNPTMGLPLFYPTQKGFTGHEHIDQLELIHMNGRVYDPVVARFISPDPYIQAPDMSQSFNRYTYVWNNPLRYTDPTGEIVFIPFIVGAIKVAGYASAVYGAYETGQAIGEGIHDVATGESTATEVAGSVAIDVAVNAALGAAGLGAIKLANKVAPGATDKAAQAVQGAVDKVSGKQDSAKSDLNAGSPNSGEAATCCFVAGTPVLTEEGYKNIEDVVIGEKLLSKDEITGEVDYKPVSHRFVKQRRFARFVLSLKRVKSLASIQ